MERMTLYNALKDALNYLDDCREDKEAVQSKYDIQCEAIDMLVDRLRENYYIDPERGLTMLDVTIITLITKEKLKEEEER